MQTRMKLWMTLIAVAVVVLAYLLLRAVGLFPA